MTKEHSQRSHWQSLSADVFVLIAVAAKPAPRTAFSDCRAQDRPGRAHPEGHQARGVRALHRDPERHVADLAVYVQASVRHLDR